MSEITRMSATAIARAVSSGALSASQVTAAFLTQTNVLNPLVNAVITLNPLMSEQARESDDRLRAGAEPRSLEGVPFVVKDNLDTAGLLTTYGSFVNRNHVPKESSAAVERMLDAGAILLGKTNTPEFATDINTTNKLFGLTRNPLDLKVSTGGSSGGTAAAIAADFAPIGLGTDHGGSIRIPSAWCGTVGIRPSPGRVPSYPNDFAWDTFVAHVCGPMARTVEDLGLVLSALAGYDARDPMTLPDPIYDYTRMASEGLCMHGMRIAVSLDLDGEIPLDPDVAKSVVAAVSVFERLGAVIEYKFFDISDMRTAIAGTRGFAMVARYADLVEVYGEHMQPHLTNQVADGLKHDLRSVALAEKARTRFWRKLSSFFQDFDFILTPMVTAPPFKVDRPLPTSIGGNAISQYYDVFLPAYIASLAGLPAMSVPATDISYGQPVGLQIIGKRLREDQVLGAAAAYAQACPQAFERREFRVVDIVDFPSTIQTPGLRS